MATFDPAEFQTFKQGLGGAPAAPSVPSVSFDPQEFATYKTAQPSMLADVAKSGVSGIAQGLINAAALTPNIINLASQGAMKLNEMAGNPLQYISPGGTGLEQAEANKQAIARASGGQPFGGVDYTPQSTLGQYTKTGGEFAGAAIGGPAGAFRGTPAQIAKQIAGQVVAPAIASETAGQLTEGTTLEPYARVGAGLAAGALGAGLTGGGPKPPQLTREQVKANASMAYKSPELADVQFTPASVNSLADKIEASLTNKLFSRDSASAAFNAADRLREIAKQPAIGVGDVHGVMDALGGAVANKSGMGKIFARKEIQNFFGNLEQPQLTTGNAARASQILQGANRDWAAQASAFEAPAMLKAAESYAKLKKISIAEALDRKAKGLLPSEKEQATRILEGTPLTKTLRVGGSFDPTKSGLALGTHALSAFLTGGATLPLSTIAGLSGRAAEAIKQSQIGKLRQDILRRSALGQTPQFQTNVPYFSSRDVPGARVPNPYYQPPSPSLVRRLLSGGLLGGYAGYLSQPN